MEEEDKWKTYFEHIRSVCPWSASAYAKDKIGFTVYRGVVYPLGSLDAMIYLFEGATPQRLKRIERSWNNQYEHYEFLYSHPQFAGNSAPYPCIIQQDHAMLVKLRENLDYYADL